MHCGMLESICGLYQLEAGTSSPAQVWQHQMCPDTDCSWLRKTALERLPSWLSSLSQFSSVQFSCSVTSDSVTSWTTARQASLSIASLQSLLKLMSIESVMPSNHLILCHVPFSSCLQSFPASGSFQMSQLFAPSGQIIGASTSASVLPVNTQDWFPLGWTGWISLLSLLSKGLSRVFSNTTVQKHQFFSVQLSVWSNSHIHAWLLEKP